MIAPNTTILLQDGKADFEVLACSKSADICLKAFVKCDKPGKVFYIRKGMLEKSKTNKAPAKKRGRPEKAK